MGGWASIELVGRFSLEADHFLLEDQITGDFLVGQLA